MKRFCDFFSSPFQFPFCSSYPYSQVYIVLFQPHKNVRQTAAMCTVKSRWKLIINEVAIDYLIDFSIVIFCQKFWQPTITIPTWL